MSYGASKYLYKGINLFSKYYEYFVTISFLLPINLNIFHDLLIMTDVLILSENITFS